MLLVLHHDDDVGVTIDGLALGESAETPGGPPVVALNPIPPGHKIALRNILAGETVRKYGAPIGQATAAIARGQHVHTHNLVSDRAHREAVPR
jgi:hypothetical protein